jgi:glycosyltransferase involved in cell wall biosynthesis
LNILLLTPQLPYPPHQGTTIRNFNLIRGLSVRHEIDLLTFIQSPDELDRAEPLRQFCRRMSGVPAPRRTTRQRLAWTLTSPLPDMALRLPSPAFRALLADWLTVMHYDVVQVEGIEMAQYGLGVPGPDERRMTDDERSSLDFRPRSLLVFDDHNAEYVLQQRAFETDVRLPGRWVGALYSLIQWQKLRRYEACACRVADRVIAVSEADADALRRLVPGLPVTVVPNGVDLDYYSATSNLQPPTSNFELVFTGKMDFRPNVDAVVWFCGQVLPRIWRIAPEVRFVIAGRDPSRRVQALAADQRIAVTGYVADVRPYIAGAGVYVVPLRVGGGTRLKVLEAMAMGKAIVSTRLGCEGIAATDGQELVVADTADDFARQVLTLLADPARRRTLGTAARRLVEQRHQWGAIVSQLEAAYRPETRFLGENGFLKGF